MNLEKMSRNDLTSTISKQNEQIKRYESRLRDVVTAYKGLVREKKALEAGLGALNTNDESSVPESSVTTLTLSMATLAAEKERMEEAFQTDKRMTREQNDKIIRELNQQLDSLSKLRQSELENLRAKLALEIQEREREHTEHSLTIKELQMKLISEKRSKEKLEDKFVISSETSVTNSELEKRFRDLTNELEATQRKLNRAEARTQETPQMLVQLQEEISIMKQNHVMALRDERIKAKRAEETAKRMCASQEERVATLEARLAELSETVGEYDRQRRKDQDVIQQLRNNVTTSIKERSDENVEREKRKSSIEDSIKFPLDAEKPIGMPYLQEIIDKIHFLKKELIIVNETMGNPVDIWSIFNGSGSSVQNIHSACRAELTALKAEYELYKKQLTQNYSSSEIAQQQKVNRNDTEKLRSHIKTLQDKVEILNQQIEEMEKECDTKMSEQQEQMKHERITHREELAEYKGRVISLEQLLQKQRERYSTLLGEREGEIRARHVKEEEGKSDTAKQHDINGSLQEVSAPPHMLHYAHELARKDLEISALRKEKHNLEGQYRDCQRDATIEKDRFKEVRRNLKEEIDRRIMNHPRDVSSHNRAQKILTSQFKSLKKLIFLVLNVDRAWREISLTSFSQLDTVTLLRIQSREGANLEYLKNVVLSFLLTADLFRKKHMLKAIAAVLHFTEAEKINAYKAAL